MTDIISEMKPAFSAKDLLKPENCISVNKKRSFSQNVSFGSKDEAKAVLADAKTVMPEVKSSYTPSGKTNAFSVLGIIILSPLVLSLIIALIVGISYIDSLISGTMNSESYSDRKNMGAIALILDFLIVCIMVILPNVSFSFISKLFKNRNAKIPSIAAYIITLLASVAVFLPIWDGTSIAPIDISMFLIPMRWVFIAIGILLIPYIAAMLVKYTVSNLKFCEESGVFLKNTRTKYINFDYTENALELLRLKQYPDILKLPESSTKDHCARVKFFSHRMANCAFLEVEALFSGKGGKGNSSFNERATWLIFSEKLPADSARTILTA